jgi:four helix bundle protein
VLAHRSFETALRASLEVVDLFNSVEEEVMKFNTFEDLDSWRVARELVNLIYDYSKAEAFSRDFEFKNQIRRAAISTMNNIAEGFERGSNRDFVKFLFIARASAGEVRSMLYIGADQNYISKSQFDQAFKLCLRLSQLCWGLIKHLRNEKWASNRVKEDDAVYYCNYTDLE